MHIRLTQPQIQSSTAAVVVLSVLLYWSKDVVDFPITLIHFVLIGSLALHFGSQLWVTFIAGFVMFRALPRQMFGEVQSQLFPLFFLLSLTMSVITMATYLLTLKADTWTLSQLVQVCVLGIGCLAAFANCLVFAPGTISAMMERCDAETKMGVSSVVGKIDSRSYSKENAKYREIHKRFIRWHCYSSLANVVTLASNLVFMYYLASKLVLR